MNNTRKKDKLVYDVGIKDADYQVTESTAIFDESGNKKYMITWTCPFYLKWKSMLQRCYSAKEQERHPTYVGCSVCEEWLRFSNFRAWMETQDWEGKELDKDLLFRGNKIYSPDNCVFIDRKINLFLTEHSTACGPYAIGVYKQRNKFIAQCGDGVKRRYVGSFNTETEAHLAWLSFKLNVARNLADEQTDPRVAKALIDRYENYTISLE